MQHYVEIAIVLCAVLFQGDTMRSDTVALAQPEHAWPVALGTGAALAARSGRDDWYDQLRGEWYIERPSDVTDVYGSGSFNLPIAGALWAAGATFDHNGTQQLGRGLARTLTMAHLVVAPLKLGVGRRRPDGSDTRSFPSGHTANAFAVARYLHRQHGTAVSMPFYGMAAITGVGRMEGNRHYLSDVLMGAALGLVVGHVTGAPDDGALTVKPRPGGLVARLRF